MIDVASRAGKHPRRPASAGMLVALVAMTAAVVLGAVFVATVLWPRWPAATGAPDAPSLPITVGGALFNVPSAAIRVPIQRRAGAQDRLDLAFVWPSLLPPDPAARPAPTEEPQPLDRLFVTINGRSGALAPAERLRWIYPRYLVDTRFIGPEGLVDIPFRDGTPYQGEDLVYDASEPERFIARCTRPGPGAVPGTCIHERQIGEADITVRFPRAWLSDWRSVAAGIEGLIAGMRPPGG